ncbi:MAG: hypothetical protein ACRDJV_05150 [Actinomycetota bacterium]
MPFPISTFALLNGAGFGHGGKQDPGGPPQHVRVEHRWPLGQSALLLQVGTEPQLKLQ